MGGSPSAALSYTTMNDKQETNPKHDLDTLNDIVDIIANRVNKLEGEIDSIKEKLEAIERHLRTAEYPE